jgi:rhamnosyltransferase
MLASIIIRTYNEQRYLEQLLQAIAAQTVPAERREVILVDSGSTDRTLEIAKQHGVAIAHIGKDEFSFGRSLNRGCSIASGEFVAFVSGHCVPVNSTWLENLIDPLRNGVVGLTYGRQVGGPDTKFSEHQLFAKYFPATTRVPQEGFFCNNANAAIPRAVWERFRFDESLTGLEDLHLAKRLLASGLAIGYVAEAAVYHHHHETWAAVRRRYEREAIALQHIMPEIHITPLDFLRYVISAVAHDVKSLARSSGSPVRIPEICAFRLMQFWGSYRGNHEHRQLSQHKKESYFYPR